MSKTWPEMTGPERDAVMLRFKREGSEAFTSGKKVEDCPYKGETNQSGIWWRRGFMNARMGATIAKAHR